MGFGTRQRYAEEVEVALFRALHEQEAFGVGVCDPHGVLTMMNPTLQEALGASYGPTTASEWSTCYHLCDERGTPLQPGRDPLARALAGEEVADVVISVRRPASETRFLQCSAVQLLDGSHDLLGAVVFVHDVTARITEQHRLEQLRDQLVSTINHEVRTPLAVVSAHLELLEDLEDHLPDSARRCLAPMARATARLREVVRTISHIADESLVAGPRVPRQDRDRGDS